ncbi:MAG: hypothetical protein KBF88_02935 [Polyangiaceae bacterium]|nr:hypothetical protein [Polyangiaceae bacterium]
MERNLGPVGSSVLRSWALGATMFGLGIASLTFLPQSANAIGGVSSDRVNEIPMPGPADAGETALHRLSVSFRQADVRGFYGFDEEALTFPTSSGFALQTIDARTGSRVRESLFSSPVAAVHSHALGPLALLENGNLVSKSVTHVAVFPQVAPVAIAGRANVLRAASTSVQLSGGDTVLSVDRTLAWIDREGSIRQRDSLPPAVPSSPIVRIAATLAGILAFAESGDVYFWRRASMGYRSPPILIVNIHRWQSIGIDPNSSDAPLLGVTPGSIERFRFSDRSAKEIAKAPSGFQFVSAAVVGPDRQMMVGVRNAQTFGLARFRNVSEIEPSPAETVLFGNIGSDGGTPAEPRIADSALGVFVALDAADLRFLAWSRNAPVALVGPLCKNDAPSYGYGRYGANRPPPLAPELVQVTAHATGLIALCLSSTLQLSLVGVRLM